MKRKAFTLAEILITLGIIGVVAALTAPALVSESTDQIVASRLAVTVSDFENAFGNAMVSEGVEELNETSIFKQSDDNKKFAGNLARYYNIGGYVEKASDKFYTKGPYTIKGTALQDFGGGKAISTYFPIRLKNGAVAHILFRENNAQYNNDKSAKETTIRKAGGSLVRAVGEIVIDVNGEIKPNRAGRDMFKYMISANGTLYPIGGRDYALFSSEGANTTNMWSNSSADALTKCKTGNLGDGFGCTARVAEEGYKINY